MADLRSERKVPAEGGAPLSRSGESLPPFARPPWINVDGLSAQEEAHVRGLKEGMLRGRQRVKTELAKRERLGLRYKRVVGRQRRLEAALRSIEGMCQFNPGNDFAWEAYNVNRDLIRTIALETLKSR